MSKDRTDKDAVILEHRKTLRSLLQRYRDLSFMETPEWDTDEEVPVKDAKRVLDSGSSEVIENEFHLLRKMSKKIHQMVHVLSQESSVEELDESLKKLMEDLKEMEEEHESLLAKQGIKRSYVQN